MLELQPIGAEQSAVTFTEIIATQKTQNMSEYMVCMTPAMPPSAPVPVVVVCNATTHSYTSGEMCVRLRVALAVGAVWI